MPQRVVFFGLLSALLLLIAIELEKREVILFPKLSLALGNASYSLYLSHTVVLLILYGIGLRTAIGNYGHYQTLFMLLFVAIIISYSLIHYTYIEQPLLKFTKKFTKKL